MDVSEELTLATTTTTTPMTPPTKDVAEELTLATTTTTSTPKDLAEELTLATTTTTPTTKDLASIVKGKRTKRQRPQSPIPFTITSHLSGGEITLYGGDHNNSSPSRPASSDEQAISTTTEDEDTARLLLMLARGQSRERSISNKKEIDHYYQDQDYTTSSFKFNSKRYIETSSTINGKAGMYVYECKTCNRTFPSFQALGGHRASHKKPKNLAIAALAEEKKQQSSYAFSDEDETSFKINNIAPISYSNMINKSSTAKIHECSYCGAEFTSGQALGGHMRRHRGANNAAPVAAPPATNTALSLSPLSPTSVNQDSEEAAKKRRKIMNHNSGLSLSLDLNLPAPEDDHNKYSSFANKNQQQQTQQQQKEPTLLLSNTPTLVDCHY